MVPQTRTTNDDFLSFARQGRLRLRSEGRLPRGVLREEIDAWADELDGPVLLGWAPGFLGDQRENTRAALTDLIEGGRLVLDHPRVVLHRLVGEIERGERDSWFEDPKA